MTEPQQTTIVTTKLSELCDFSYQTTTGEDPTFLLKLRGGETGAPFTLADSGELEVRLTKKTALRLAYQILDHCEYSEVDWEAFISGETEDEKAGPK